MLNTQLHEMTFGDVIHAVADMAPGAGRADVIQLYRDWIACQGDTAPHLYAAWFNLAAN